MKRWLPTLALITAACTADQTSDEFRDTTARMVDTPAAAVSPTYDFERPALTVELPDDLREISGLTVLADGHLGAVQDEVGTVFVIHRETGAIESTQSFAGAGDYEGIEQVGDRLYVLLSDGTLTELSSGSSEPRVIETALGAKNDTEGLAYDEARNRLLIACKENPGGGLDKEHKAVYAFDLAEGALDEEPAYVIDTDELESRYDVRGTFKPSALALHPSDGTLYVLSATSKSIAVLGEDGAVQSFQELPGNMFEQPEALVFGSDGRLYIASEGDKGPGMLYAFSPQAQ